MRVTLFPPSGGDTHEAGVVTQPSEVSGARISHARTQSSDELVHDLAQRAGIGNAALDALRHELAACRTECAGGARRGLGAGVTIGAESLHGAHRTHPSIALEPAALEQLHVAGALLGAGEKRAEHHALGAGRYRLDDVAGVGDPTVGDHRDVPLPGPSCREPDRRQLRHARAADDASGADRTSADANLDRIGSGVGEGVDAVLGDHVAGDHGQRGPARLDPLDRLDHACRVSVGGVDTDCVDGGSHQRLDPSLEVVADAHCGGTAEPAAAVLRCVGELEPLLDVLHRDEPGEPAVGVDERQLLDAVLLEDQLRLFERRTHLRRDEAVTRHELGDRALEIDALAEADVAVRQDADEGTLLVGDRHAGELELRHQRLCLVQPRRRGQCHRVGDHAALTTLDLSHLSRLLCDAEVAVDHTDPALARHGDRHAGLRDAIHGRRHERDVELDVGREAWPSCRRRQATSRSNRGRSRRRRT